MEGAVYAWRLDASTVGDVRAGRKILDQLPDHTGIVVMDGAYDAFDVYEPVDANGAQPIIQPPRNARTQTRDARRRALREHVRHPTRWQRLYNRRPIVESVNYACVEADVGSHVDDRHARGEQPTEGLLFVAFVEARPVRKVESTNW